MSKPLHSWEGGQKSPPSTDMKEITTCVICGKDLKPDRKHVDTCGERCYRAQLKAQREQE